MTDTCTIDGCDLRHHARGWCARHYNRNRRHGSPHIVLGNHVPPVLDRRCSLYRCDKPHHAKGFCHPHYEIARRGFEPTPPPVIEHRTKCERCGEEPMGGGRWCLTHFQAYVTEQDLTNPRRRKPPAHGTENARSGHRRRGEPLCPECHASATTWIDRMTHVA